MKGDVTVRVELQLEGRLSGGFQERDEQSYRGKSRSVVKAIIFCERPSRIHQTFLWNFLAATQLEHSQYTKPRMWKARGLLQRNGSWVKYKQTKTPKL